MKLRIFLPAFILISIFFSESVLAQRFAILDKSLERVSLKTADYNGFRRNQTILTAEIVNAYMKKYLPKDCFLNINYFIPSTYNFTEFYGVNYNKDGFGRRALRIETTVLDVNPEKILQIVERFFKNEKTDNGSIVQYVFSSYKIVKSIDTAIVNKSFTKPISESVKSILDSAYSCDYFLEYLKLPFNCFYKSDRFVLASKLDSSHVILTTPNIWNFYGNADKSYFLFDNYKSFYYLKPENGTYTFDKYEIKSDIIDETTLPKIMNIDNKIYFMTFLASYDSTYLQKRPEWIKKDPFFTGTTVVTFSPLPKLLISETWDMIEKEIIQESKKF